jgi:hippurate hydrolase
MAGTSTGPGPGPSLLSAGEAALGPAVELRRRIHAHPEVGLELPGTQAIILQALDGLGLEVSTGQAVTSVVAVLQGDRPGPTTLLRADMDALPMPENTGLPFASQVDGAMHACGHDAHVAMLVGAAHVLAERRAELPGRVVFMFQPGEEGHGGAEAMLAEGLLERYGPMDRAFAIHISPTQASGSMFTRVGAIMASADQFQVTVTGRGGHASAPHDAVDPIPVACEIVTSLQVMVTRRVPIFDPAVVTVSRVTAGTTSNVIPETAVLEGTVRALSETTRALVLERLAQVVEHIALAHLCTAELTSTPVRFPVLENDAEAARRVIAVASAVLGPERAVEMASPIMGAEDWSYVLRRVPGAMAFLGASPPGVEHPAPNHSNRMLIDEGAMAAGIAMHAAMALA